MSKHTRLVIALILILAPFSIALKISKPTWIHEQHEVPITQEFKAFLASSGLTYFDAYKTINSDAYKVSLFQTTLAEDCFAMVYVIPMPINAEAEFIIARPLAVAAADFFFVFNGAVSDRYPSLKQWAVLAANRLRDLMNLPKHNAIVYGIASSAPCVNPRGFAWDLSAQ